MVPFIDASVFLGMHHSNDVIKEQSIKFFHSYFQKSVRMNYEQIGLCDAVIWEQNRSVQDSYYPFMDVLHTDMKIIRNGYHFDDIAIASSDSKLGKLKPEKRLLCAQILRTKTPLFTHDPELQNLECLQPYLEKFEHLKPDSAFPPHLTELYKKSQIFIYKGMLEESCKLQ